MHFTKLRVSGFKSFVDPVEMMIEPGLTGVVGPNGCGKSNVVEALRWVMGETSAKSLRGSGMEDVIFGGTTTRPARNIAEVVLYLDNRDRKAPAMFNDAEELEISRRIERDSGSTYRVNGREVRARDVQLLFADLATGAHSTAMVSQGRVAAMIGAKPTERRALLEEAAGIKGLHSRRHEAELRLRAAETNLERLEDVIGALLGQHQGLQRQARQAARYRRLSEQIRQFDAILLYHSWSRASEAVDTAKSRLEAVAETVAERTAAAASTATAQADAAAALPALRQAEAEAAAALQHLQLARRELDSEAERVTTAREEVANRSQQIAADIERETTLGADAAAALDRLDSERDTLSAAQAGESETRGQAATALAEATRLVEEHETSLHDLTSFVADAEARRGAIGRRISELKERIERLSRRQEEAEAERVERAMALEQDAELAAAAEAVEKAERSAEATRERLEAAEAARADAETVEAESRAAAQDAESVRSGLAAEAHALAELLEPREGDNFPPVIDSLAVTPGYETALGAALGEDLTAATDEAAPIRWTGLPALDAPPLPDQVPPLGRFVQAPPQLARRLAAIGVVGNAAEGARLAADLAPGQRIVSRDGGLWRWDGFVVAAGAQTSAATRLAQRNRLGEVREAVKNAEARVESTRSALEAATELRTEAVRRERAAREEMRESFAAVGSARDAYGKLLNVRAAAESRLGSLVESLQAMQSDREETTAEFVAAQDALADLEDTAAQRDRIAALRTELAELRMQQAERRSAHDRLEADTARRAERLQAIEAEVQSWRQRSQGAQSRLADLEARRIVAEQERQRLALRPEEIEVQRTALMDQIAEAEARRGAAVDRLATAETTQIEADRNLRAAEQTLAEAREDRVRAEAQLEQAEHDRETVAVRVRERLDTTPEGILEAGGIEEAGLPDAAEAGSRLERLARERDAMGPVNLRAEKEAEDLQEQIDTLQAERDDLLAAIARLRQGIVTLNREGRERLMAAFTQVNDHFQELFTRLYGGGYAHLTLIESEDPLESGVEIMASPPGKKLTTMSLLSGGEQALTAVALLFAVFLTNPAPICVLDEVDAPLDDSNVDRFCALVEDIARGGTTRFLVVTHHRMTMARMDRLFGVTMGEPGVSQLVSVDLHRAVALRESA